MTLTSASGVAAPTPGGVTGVVLAGGRGSRMGGVDKGLQPFLGLPLALHALRRLQQQRGDWIAATLLNANRNLAAYAALGAPVCPDARPDHAGPLAGFLTGLTHCATPWLLTVPCDSPRLPLDLAQRLAEAVAREGTAVAVACAREADGGLRRQPVFCLLHTALAESLMAYTEAGGRKIEHWLAQHAVTHVPFDRPGDDPHAFFNANTLAQLRQLENL